MKRILFAAALAAFAALPMHAQFGSGQTTRTAKQPAITPAIGLKAGVNFTNLNGNVDDVKLGDGMGFGFGGGVYANLRFNSQNSKNGKSPFALQAEVVYEANKAATKGDADLELGRLAIPVMLQVYPFNNVKHLNGLYLEAGASFELGLSSSPDVLNVSPSTYQTGDLKANDVRVAVGAGYLTQCGLGVGVRYYVGTSEMAKSFPLKANTFEVGLSYQFKIGK